MNNKRFYETHDEAEIRQIYELTGKVKSPIETLEEYRIRASGTNPGWYNSSVEKQIVAFEALTGIKKEPWENPEKYIAKMKKLGYQNPNPYEPVSFPEEYESTSQNTGSNGGTIALIGLGAIVGIPIILGSCAILTNCTLRPIGNTINNNQRNYNPEPIQQSIEPLTLCEQRGCTYVLPLEDALESQQCTICKILFQYQSSL